MNCGSEWIYYGAGMVYKKNRHFKEAEEKFRYLLAIYPSYGNAYVQLGFIRKNEGILIRQFRGIQGILGLPFISR